MDERAANRAANIAFALEHGLDQRLAPSASGEYGLYSPFSFDVGVALPQLPAAYASLGSRVVAKEWAPVWDYRGKDVDNPDSGDFSSFLAFIGPVAAPPTKFLRFGLGDGLESSGVLEFLDINFDNPSTANDKALTDIQKSARTILCDAIANQRRDLPEGASLSPNQIHLKPVFDAYIKLLSNCKDMECIEMPLAWAGLFRAVDVFPKVNVDREGDLELLRDQMTVRWGKDPAREERSLTME